jgi:hypothetical protein
LSEAGPGFAKAARASNEKLRTLQAQAREANLRMLEAEELERAGDIDAARKLRAEGVGKAVEIGGKIAQMRSTEKVAGIYMTPRGAAAVEGRLAAEIEKDPTLTPQQKLEAVRGLGKRTSADTQILRTRITGLDSRIKETEKALALPQSVVIPEIKQSLENRLAELKAEKAALVAENPELAAGTVAAPAGAQGVTSTPRLPYGFQLDR